jgi:hypothetical protein
MRFYDKIRVALNPNNVPFNAFNNPNKPGTTCMYNVPFNAFNNPNDPNNIEI